MRPRQVDKCCEWWEATVFSTSIGEHLIQALRFQLQTGMESDDTHPRGMGLNVDDIISIHLHWAFTYMSVLRSTTSSCFSKESALSLTLVESYQGRKGFRPHPRDGAGRPSQAKAVRFPRKSLSKDTD